MTERRRNNAELEKVDGSEPTMKQSKIEDFFEKWNNLPVEMKEECMKNMEIKSRFRLRGTSKTEKEIVDALQFSVGTITFKEKSLEIENYDTSTKIEDITINFENGNDVKVNNYLPLIAHILNRCKIDTLKIYENCFLNGNFLEKLEELIEGEIHIKHLKSRDSGCQKTVFFLKKCKKVDSLEVNVLYTAFPVAEFYSIPSVISAKHSLLLNPEYADFQQFDYQAVEHNDLKEGTRMRLVLADKAYHHAVRSELKVMGWTGGRKRFMKLTRTENPPKRCLLWHAVCTPTSITLNNILVPSGLDKAGLIKYTKELYSHDKDILMT